MVNLSPRKPSMPGGPLLGGLGLMEVNSNGCFFGGSVWDSNGMTANAKAVQDNTTFPVSFMGIRSLTSLLPFIDTAPPFSVATMVLEFAVDDAGKEQYGNRCRHFPLARQGAACGQPRPLKVVDRDYLIGGGWEEHPHLALYARMNTSLLKLALTDPAA